MLVQVDQIIQPELFDPALNKSVSLKGILIYLEYVYPSGGFRLVTHLHFEGLVIQ